MKLVSIRTLLEFAVVLAFLLILGVREAFPANLSDACELRDFQLNGTTKFLTTTRFIFENFWESEHAPACLDDAVEEEEEEDIDDHDDSTSFWLDDAIEWTGKFGSFSNTVLEDALLPKLPGFLSTKVRSVASSIADSWDPAVVERVIIATWIFDVEPRIPESVKAAWVDAFAVPLNESKEATDEDLPSMTTTTDADTPIQDDNVLGTCSTLRAFGNFTSDSIKARCKAVASSFCQAVQDSQFYSVLLLTTLYVVFLFIIAFIHKYTKGPSPSKQQQDADRERVALEWSRFTSFLEAAEIAKTTLSGQDFYYNVTTSAHAFLPSDACFDKYRAYLDDSSPQSRSIFVVYGLLELALNNRPEHFTEEQTTSCERLFKLVRNGLFDLFDNKQPVTDWTDIEELYRFAEAQRKAGSPIEFPALSALFYRCLPMHVHFNPFMNQFKEYLGSPDQKPKKVWRSLTFVLHGDRAGRVFKEEQVNVLINACPLVNGAWDDYEAVHCN